jgi:hypothetical protein
MAFFKPFYSVHVSQLKNASCPYFYSLVFIYFVYAKIHQFMLNLGMHIKFINHFALFAPRLPFYHQAGVGKARLIIGKNIILFVKKHFRYFRADFCPVKNNFEMENFSN